MLTMDPYSAGFLLYRNGGTPVFVILHSSDRTEGVKVTILNAEPMS